MTKLNMKKLNKAWREKSNGSTKGIKLDAKLATFIKSCGKEVPPTKSERIALAHAILSGREYKPPIKKSKVRKRTTQKADKFYSSWEWKKLRFEVFEKMGRRCMCCGWEPLAGNKGYLCVDHILPRRKFPEKELDIDNMQVLCNSCNMGKSNRYTTKFDPYDEADRFWMDDVFSSTIQ